MFLKNLQVCVVSAVVLSASFAYAGDEVAPKGNRLDKNILHEQIPNDNLRYGEDIVEIAVESANLFAIGHELNYHIAPQMFSVHWQLDDVGNEGWLRGNTTWTFTGYYSPVFKGPENYQIGALFGPRYHFVQPGWKWIPFAESRVGFGFTDSRSIRDGQGQDFFFTFIVGIGVRYDFDERWSLILEALYQHSSNAGLSEPDHPNNGIDAIGPNVSILFKL